MENLEDIQISGRVTRSLRKRLTSVDSNDTGSRPTTPLPQKLTAIPELNSPSRPARMTRRSSITSLSTPAKTPGKTKVTAFVETTGNTAGTPARRSTRKRSLSVSEDTPSKVGTKPTVSQPKFDTLTEEGTKSSNTTPASVKRATRSQSKSPQQEELDTARRSSHGKASHVHKPAPKSKKRYYYSGDSDSDVEIIHIKENEQNAAKHSNEENVETAIILAKQQTEKEETSPKKQIEQVHKTMTKSPKEKKKEEGLVTLKASPLDKSIKEVNVSTKSESEEAKIDEIINLDDSTHAAPLITQNGKDTSLDEVQQSPAPKSDQTHTPKRQAPTATLKGQTATVSPKKQTPTATPKRQTATVSPKKQTPTATPKKQIPVGTPKKQTPTVAPKISAIKSSPIITEMVKLQRLSPEVIAKFTSRNSQSESPVKSNNSANSKSVAFNDSDVDDSMVKSVYPKTPALTKSKSYIDVDSPKEADDKSFQSDKGSMMVSFKDAKEGVESGRSSRADGADISKESLEYHDATNVLGEEEDVDTLLLQEKTPHKSKLRLSYSSSTPVVMTDGKSEPLHKRPSMEMVLEEKRENVSLDSEKSLRSGKTYGDSPKSPEKSLKKLRSESEETAQVKLHNRTADMDDVEDTVLLKGKENDSKVTAENNTSSKSQEGNSSNTATFDSSWIPALSGQANKSAKIDAITVKKTPDKESFAPLMKVSSPQHQEEDKQKPDEVSEDTFDGTSYFDNEAIEADADYHSGDSLTVEERQEMNENEIEEAGESIGSVDTEESVDDEEEANEENASFVTTDSDEILLEYSDDDEHLHNEASPPKAKIYKRLRNISDSDESETEKTADKIQNGNEPEAALTMDVTKMIDQSINNEESDKVNGSVGINQELKKKRNSLNGSKTYAEATGENVETEVVADSQEASSNNLDISTKAKKKSLNQSENQKEHLNKSAGKNNPCNIKYDEIGRASTESGHASNVSNTELETSIKITKLAPAEELDTIVIKRTSLGTKQIDSIMQGKRKSCNGSAVVERNGSKDESEKRCKSLNDSLKMNGMEDKKERHTLSKSWKETIANSSSSSDEEDPLSACQSVRMQRAEVYESSDESDEIEATADLEKSRNTSVNEIGRSKNMGNEHEIEVATSAEDESKLNSLQQKRRKSLNSSLHEANANVSRSTKESKQLTAECYKEEDNVEPEDVRCRTDDVGINSFEKNHNDDEKCDKRKSLNKSQSNSLEKKIKSESLGEDSDDEADSGDHDRKSTVHECNIDDTTNEIENGNENGSDSDSVSASTSDGGNDNDEKKCGSLSVSNKNTAEKSTESESDDVDNDNNEDSDVEATDRASKLRKASAGLSVSFGHAKKDKNKDVICGKIKHSSFTIGVTVKKNSCIKQTQPADSSDSSEVADVKELSKKENSASSQSNNSSTGAQYFSSDEAQNLEKLAYTECTTKISENKRRQSLAERQTVDGSPIVKTVKRKSLCHSKEQFNPSKSFMEDLLEKKGALLQEKATNSRRLSKSFCSTAAVNENVKKNSVVNAGYGDLDVGLMKEIPNSSAPRHDKMVTHKKKVDIEQILGRCDDILEAANEAKLELKRNAKKSKVKLHKKMKEPKVEHEQGDSVTLVNEHETKKKEKVKTALEQALKASANILLKTKKEKSNVHAQIEENQMERKRLPMQLLEAISNSEPKSAKRKKDSSLNLDRENTSHSMHTIKSTSGDIIEEAVTPPKKKKSTVNKFEIPSGVVYEEALTPKKQKSVIGDFRVSPVTPRSIGSKVRKILTAGQDVIPTQSQKERKRKLAIAEPKLVLPKPKWTKSGEFVEEELLPTARTVIRTGATEFLVSALHGASKQKANKLATNTACANALNFKKSAMHRENLPRESAHEVLQRKERRRVHNNF